MTTNLSGYNFAYLDEQTKRMIRRAILKAVAIPGYQVPFGGREMPMPYGWGTGGIQLTASVIGEPDILKVIDQGADDTTNAVSIRNFFKRVTGVNTTERTEDATLIQTRKALLNVRRIFMAWTSFLPATALKCRLSFPAAALWG